MGTEQYIYLSMPPNPPGLPLLFPTLFNKKASSRARRAIFPVGAFFISLCWTGFPLDSCHFGLSAGWDPGWPCSRFDKVAVEGDGSNQWGRIKCWINSLKAFYWMLQLMAWFRLFQCRLLYIDGRKWSAGNGTDRTITTNWRAPPLRQAMKIRKSVIYILWWVGLREVGRHSYGSESQSEKGLARWNGHCQAQATGNPWPRTKIHKWLKAVFCLFASLLCTHILFLYVVFDSQK